MSHCKIFRDYIFVDDVANAFLNVIKLNAIWVSIMLEVAKLSH